MLPIRLAISQENNYAYSAYPNETETYIHTGCIGHLRGDFGSNGNEFWTTWFDHCKALKTEDFKEEFDEVINSLRSDEYGLLKNRTAMRAYISKYPEDRAFRGGFFPAYIFRIDTKKYTYLLRCCPIKGDYNFYCYCYKKVTFDKFLEEHTEA